MRRITLFQVIYFIGGIFRSEDRQNQLYRRYATGFGYRLMGIDWCKP